MTTLETAEAKAIELLAEVKELQAQIKHLDSEHEKVIRPLTKAIRELETKLREQETIKYRECGKIKAKIIDELWDLIANSLTDKVITANKHESIISVYSTSNEVYSLDIMYNKNDMTVKVLLFSVNASSDHAKLLLEASANNSLSEFVKSARYGFCVVKLNYYLPDTINELLAIAKLLNL